MEKRKKYILFMGVWMFVYFVARDFIRDGYKFTFDSILSTIVGFIVVLPILIWVTGRMKAFKE